MSASTAVAVQDQQQHPLAEMVSSEKARRMIEPFLPQGVDIRRVAASLVLAVRQDESRLLAQCTSESLVLGLAQIHKWGLELGKDSAYLLPFKNKRTGKYEAAPCADYKALGAQLVASGAVRYVDAREVREGDTIEFAFGLDAKLVHQPFGGRDRLKKPITHAYVVFHLPFGARAFDVMTAEEIEEVRQTYSRQHKEGPLKRFYAVKTVLRRAAKMLPKDRRLAKFFDLLEEDRRVEFGDREIRPDADETPIALDDRWVEEQERPTREPGEEA